MGKRRHQTVGFAVGVATALVAVHALAPATADVIGNYRQLGLFGDVYERVRTNYVEPVDGDLLVKNAINGMLSGLDPHSSYLSPKEWTDLQVVTRGEFGGLGIEVAMEEGYVKVVSPIDDTPASRAGLLANDLITRIDGDTVQGLTLQQAVDRMRGAVSSPITLIVVRKGADKPIELTLVRETIKVRPVRTRLEGDVGYVRISTFNERTFDALKEGIAKLSAEGGDRIKGYVVDLRNNPGGRLDQAVRVGTAFVGNREIVSTRGRKSGETNSFSLEGEDLTGDKPIAVLINGGSASASEIVAGAIQDYGRGKLVGSKSFGKGSVQSLVPLGAQGALKLTTALYYTPSGRSIQARGVEPDVAVAQDVPEELKGRDVLAGEAGLKGHLRNVEEDGKGGSSAYVPADPAADKQLAAALDIVRKGERPPRKEADVTRAAEPTRKP